MKPKLKLFFLLTAPFLMFANVPVAQADVITYNVNEVFYEPVYKGDSNTVFTGSFSYDSTAQTITSLTGTLSEAMTGPPQTLVPLTYQLATAPDGSGGITATVFALNSTNVFSQGGYDYTQGQNTNGNSNAYATIDFNAGNPTLGATSLNLLSYADCTAGGLMGTACMTGHVGGGTMMATPLSEVITVAVPEPEEYGMMLLGFGLVGYQLKRKQRKSAQFMA